LVESKKVSTFAPAFRKSPTGSSIQKAGSLIFFAVILRELKKVLPLQSFCSTKKVFKKMAYWTVRFSHGKTKKAKGEITLFEMMQ